ncbi:MAG: rRNA maturation RNase YbeY [Rhodanobacteraceae bacterium]
MAPPVEVYLSYGVSRRGLPSPASFRRWTLAALTAAHRCEPAELSIRIVGLREGRALNRRYRGKDDATNVLSFALDSERPGLPAGVDPHLLGDIAICASVVAREARSQGKNRRDHYAHLTVHGMLHLLGHDHQTLEDASRMETLETRILAGLGVADPY